ncbi:MAG: T9SS type A sorting domain-containing protein [Chitinophagaceae bacterium]
MTVSIMWWYRTNGCEGVSDTIQSNVLKVDEQSLSSIRLYPNPTQNSVHIDATAKVNVLVSDMAGRQILQLKEVNEVDLSSFTDGMYLFRISDKEGRLLLIEKVNKVSGQ